MTGPADVRLPYAWHATDVVVIVIGVMLAVAGAGLATKRAPPPIECGETMTVDVDSYDLLGSRRLALVYQLADGAPPLPPPPPPPPRPAGAEVGDELLSTLTPALGHAASMPARK